MAEKKTSEFKTVKKTMKNHFTIFFQKSWRLTNNNETESVDSYDPSGDVAFLNNNDQII